MLGLALDLKKRFNRMSLNVLLADVGLVVPFKTSQAYLWSWLHSERMGDAHGPRVGNAEGIQFVGDNLDNPCPHGQRYCKYM